jgi:uncharacterized protein (DUF488 family)
MAASDGGCGRSMCVVRRKAVVMIGTIYTLGYAAAGAAEQLEALMADPQMLLLDVRLVPRSRWWPQWSKPQLRAKWGKRYSHEKQLGNVNYKDASQPVVFAGRHPERAIAGAVALLLQGYSLVLLCVCKEEESCHRLLVAQLIQQALEATLQAHARAIEERWEAQAWDMPDRDWYGFPRDEEQVDLG